MDTIDIRVIEPARKHETIFELLDLLKEGESFAFHNDHDPKPLYYELVSERGQIFNWEYLTEGPEIWKVMITKKALSQEPKTIGEMVAKDFRSAEVFRKYGLDFCCGGKRTLQQACEKKNIDANTIQGELDKLAVKDETTELDYNQWDLDFLADYIVAKHHKYVADSNPMLYELSTKVARVHGAQHPELAEIASLFHELAEELDFHMHKEEMILFPYIKELYTADKNGTAAALPPFGTIKNPINMMEAEHVSAGSNLERIKELSNNYTVPPAACNSFRVLYAKLQEYEQDLHTHIHLENNILFKKAIELEDKMFQR